MSIRVLIADDHPLIQAGIQAVLGQDSRFTVVGQANSGDQALSEVKDKTPDVLLLDLEMPGMRTDELLPLVAENSSATKTIILTSHDSPEYVQKVRKQKIHGYLLKSEVGPELVQAIQAVHLGAAWFTQKIALQMMAPANADDPLEELTPREREVLKLVGQGLDNQAISAQLHLAEQTVRNYVSTVYDKLGLSGRVEAVVWVRERGLLN